MKDGRKLVGYVAWYSSYDDKESKVPHGFIDPNVWQGEEKKGLQLYIQLYLVSKKVLRSAFPGSDNGRMLIATRSDTLTLPIKQIARIRAVRMRYDGSDATIDGIIIGIRSRTILRALISEDPLATFDDNEGTAFVSFNRHIGRRKLAKISAALTRQSTGKGIPANPEKAWGQTSWRLERQRVVMIPYIRDG